MNYVHVRPRARFFSGKAVNLNVITHDRTPKLTHFISTYYPNIEWRSYYNTQQRRRDDDDGEYGQGREHTYTDGLFVGTVAG